jgi:hypothetical protein
MIKEQEEPIVEEQTRKIEEKHSFTGGRGEGPREYVML